MDTMEVDGSMTDQQAKPHSLVQTPQANSSKVSDSVPIPSSKSLFTIEMSRMALTRPIIVFCFSYTNTPGKFSRDRGQGSHKKAGT